MTDQNCHFIFWRTEAADINLKKINKATDLLSHRKEKKKKKNYSTFTNSTKTKTYVIYLI